MAGSVTKIGDWKVAERILATAPTNLRIGIDTALRQEAEGFRKDVIQGIKEQAPGGQRFEPLAETTKARRKFMNRRGTKALIERGDLRRSVTVKKEVGGYFVGVLRGRESTDGRQLVNIAATHEFGATITVTMTDKMRKFLAMLFRRAGFPRTTEPAQPTIVIKIPPRPFLQPVADKRRPEMAKRVMDAVGKQVLGL